jgi:hypothetical protein
MLDFLTTLAFLLNGVGEANPLVNAALTISPAPWVGLALVKVLALVVGFTCWRLGRYRLLARANAFFAALVAWNLLALILAS